jgi:hypothetical protein
MLMATFFDASLFIFNYLRYLCLPFETGLIAVCPRKTGMVFSLSANNKLKNGAELARFHLRKANK